MPFFPFSSNPSQSQERSTPFFSSPAVSHALPPPLYTPPDFQDPSKQQWLQPPNDAPPPPYEAVADTQYSREESPLLGASISNAASRELSPISEDVNRETGPLGMDSTRHKLQPKDHADGRDGEETEKIRQEASREQGTDMEGKGKQGADTTQTGDNKTSSQTRNASDNSCTFDDMLVGRRNSDEDPEVSRNSPGLMRATTRLAGIGFGARAAARALRSSNVQRQQRKTVRNRTKDQVDGQEVKSCGEETDGEERRDNGDGAVRDRRADSDMSDGDLTIATTS